VGGFMKHFFNVLIVIWIAIACFNVLYNLQKTYTEFKEWAFLSDSEKRHKIFGNLYDFQMLIRQNTRPNDRILIFHNGGEQYQIYFFSIYNLYPRRIRTTISKKEFRELLNNKQFPYVAALNFPIESKHYKKVASFSAQRSDEYGSIYKLK